MLLTHASLRNIFFCPPCILKYKKLSGTISKLLKIYFKNELEIRPDLKNEINVFHVKFINSLGLVMSSNIKFQ